MMRAQQLLGLPVLLQLLSYRRDGGVRKSGDWVSELLLEDGVVPS